MEEIDTLQGAVQGLCTLIEKYDQHERAIAIKGVTPIVSGKLINYNLIKGIDINDSAKSIRTIYKRLALITHPDKGGNKNDLTILNNAVEMLRDDPGAINQVLMNLMQSRQTKRGDTQVELPFADTFPSENYAAKKSPVDIPVANAIMNDFIQMYFRFYQLRRHNAPTSGEIDPYFYAKNAIETTYPGVTVLPFDGDNEETFNANIKNYVEKGEGSLPSFEEFVRKFEVVKSYNVKRIATQEEKQRAIAQIDENILKRQQVTRAAQSPAYLSVTKRPYQSSVTAAFRKGGSKTKRKQTKIKRNRNKTNRKRSRKTRRPRR
jgi:hypothetical protein